MSSPFFTVLPGHDLAYNEIVKPSRRWAFSYYFLHRWLPLLHPQQAMLIQVLRQSTWRNGTPTGRCQISNGVLCTLLGWSDSSHKTLLGELDRPLTDWFVTRERTRKRHVTQGHAVEGAPHYRITMDDPLTPGDQAALQELLSKWNPTSPYEAAEILDDLARHKTKELWAMLDEHPLPPALPAQPATVAEVAISTWTHIPASTLTASQPFLETAEKCQLRLTGAGYAHMELDYVLRSWLPTLGINQTWLVIALRARCFYDPATGETRDTVTISRKELEEQLSIPTRTFRRLLREEQGVELFHISPAGEELDPTNPRNIPHRGDLTFHVAFPLLPICPSDQATYQSLLLAHPEGDSKPDLSTTGQITRLEAANQPGWQEGAIHNRPTNPSESGQPTRLSYVKAANQPGSKRPINPAEWVESGQPTRLEPANQPDIQETKTNNKLSSEKQETPLPFGKGGENAKRLEIQRLLVPFGIRSLERILQNPGLTVAEVRGWIYRGREEVDEKQMGGYLVRRLIGTSDPLEDLPAEYRLAGEVDTWEEMLFEEWWLGELAPPPFTDERQRDRYGAWLKVVKEEIGNPDRPDYSPHACWRREMARISEVPS